MWRPRRGLSMPDLMRGLRRICLPAVSEVGVERKLTAQRWTCTGGCGPPGEQDGVVALSSGAEHGTFRVPDSHPVGRGNVQKTAPNSAPDVGRLLDRARLGSHRISWFAVTQHNSRDT